MSQNPIAVGDGFTPNHPDNPTPRGIPTLTYVRVVNDTNASSDITIDNSFVTVSELGQPSSRHEVAFVFERDITDQQFCESTIGQDAGAALGAELNPVSTFVEDATSAVVLLVGAKSTKKWQFIKVSYCSC